MSILGRALCAAWAMLLLGCGPFTRSPEAPVQRPSVPIGRYGDIAWLPNDWLVVRYTRPSGDYPYLWHLWRLRSDGSEFTQLNLPDDPACRLTRYHRPTALPNGLLGIQRECLSWDDGYEGRPVGLDTYHLMTYDLTTDVARPWLDLPREVTGHLGSQVTWNPAMTRGMVIAGLGLCEHTAWITPSGVVEYATITIRDGDRSWRLDAPFFSDRPLDDCGAWGRANSPAWSPDGRIIAFFAAPQAIGVRGLGRAYVHWNLYLMDPVEQVPRKVLADVKFAGSLTWSPNGQWLAFTGELPWWRAGLWLFAPASGQLHHVTSLKVGSLAWSPDGEQIMARRTLQPPSQSRSELLLFDVSAIVAAS